MRVPSIGDAVIRLIASKCNDLDENDAYVLGLLHDIGRRDGVADMRHILSGYNFMISQGYDKINNDVYELLQL